jgi:hypothetical protein
MNRDRGKLCSFAPPTPPDMRVRIRRFGGLSVLHASMQIAGVSRTHVATVASVPDLRCLRASPIDFASRPDATGVCRMASMRRTQLLLASFRSGLQRIALPTMPSADFSNAITDITARSVRGFPNTPEISRGKDDRLPRTPAGFTTLVLDDRGLRSRLPARPAR